MSKKNLIVVYEKGYEPAVQLVKKLIETKDDKTEGDKKKIIGVEDGAISVGEMSEKQYFDNKMSISSSQKILFVGDVKGKKGLEMIMETLYEGHGVVIGKAGNQMLLTTSVLPLVMEDAYTKFISDCKKISSIPITKQERKIGLNWKTALKAGVSLTPGIGWYLSGGLLGKDAYDDKKLVQNQQMLFAVQKIYLEFLDDFIKA